jgi:hypothetical protein
VLVEYFVNLPYLEKMCIAGEEIYNQMKQRNQLESFEAFMHWMEIRETIYYQPYYMYVEDKNKAKCQRVCDEQKANADKHIDQFLQLYDSGSYKANLNSRKNKYPATFKIQMDCSGCCPQTLQRKSTKRRQIDQVFLRIQ